MDALGVVERVGGQAPRAFGWGLAVAQAAIDGPREVAVVGMSDDPLRAELHRAALLGTAPGLVVAVGEPDTRGVPLLADRPLLAGHAGAYVCQNFTCGLPTSSVDDLADSVRSSVGS